MMRAGAASFHFCTAFRSPMTTAVTFSRSYSASTAFMYSSGVLGRLQQIRAILLGPTDGTGFGRAGRPPGTGG